MKSIWSLPYFFLFCIAILRLEGQTSQPCDLAWPVECDEPAQLPDFNTLFVSKQSSAQSPFRYLDCYNEGDELVNYAQSYHFKHLVIFGIKDYLEGYQPECVSNLRRLIRVCHENGLTVSLTVGKYENAGNLRLYFDDPGTLPSEKYDALCMESEPWNSTPDLSWNTYFSSINKHRAFCDTRQKQFEIYIGNPSTQDQVNQICAAASRIYVTYYRSHPCDNAAYQNIFHFKVNRLEMLANATPAPAKLSILFSARPSSNDPNMSAWMAGVQAAHPGLSFQDILKLPFRRWYACPSGYLHNLPAGMQDPDIAFEIGAKKLDIQGHAWYSYQDLRRLTGPMGGTYACNDGDAPVGDRNSGAGSRVQSLGAIQSAQTPDGLTLTVPSEVLEEGICQYIIYGVNGRVHGQGTLSNLQSDIATQTFGNGIYFIAVLNKELKYRQVSKFCKR